MAGRTAGILGPESGIISFDGGHKLPKLAPTLADSLGVIRLRVSGKSSAIEGAQRPIWCAGGGCIRQLNFACVQHALEGSGKYNVQRTSPREMSLRW